jgi:ubiquinone/menaquinone biosynthesis C-methylase UbiE
VRRGFFARVAEEIRYWTQASWSLAQVEKHYDDLAACYDAVNEAAHSHFRRFTDALRLAHLPDEARALEIFSRTGEGMTFFYEQGKVGSAACVDVSRKMGEICRLRLREVGLDDAVWVQMVDYALPFEDGEFDVVFFLETIEHVSRPACLVRELGRVTRPEGMMILSTPNVLWEPMHALAAITGLHHSEGPHRFIRYRRLTEMVEQGGFQIEHAETNVLIPAGPRWLVRFGAWLEDRVPDSLIHCVGLRRMLICRRQSWGE